ncbi:MAG: inositol monophosphatase family protein [Terriglobales bacterium]
MTVLAHPLLAPVRKLHAQIRDAVVVACERSSTEAMSGIAQEQEEGDTIYAIDRVSEELIIEFFEREATASGGIILIAEGLHGGQVVLPRGASESDVKWRIIVDPIDGTRGIMYQKRSAWVLTGVAPNRGPQTGIHDIELSVQTEIPLVKQHLCDAAWAVRDGGVEAERYNRLNGLVSPLTLKPSKARTIAHGFAMVARFFPGAREELAALDEEIVRGALGPVQPGKAHCFEDQYASTGGQLFELMAGYDRFIADLRPLMEAGLRKRGLALGICCHPYDISTELIARELGVIVSNPLGQPIHARLSVEPDVAWVGYANGYIRSQIEPLLHAALRKRDLI